MNERSVTKQRLDLLRPLGADQIDALWAVWRSEDARFVYATNAIEGSALTLSETLAVLQDGITVRGKPMRDHLDARQGKDAYMMMLDFAQRRVALDLQIVLDLHRLVVGAGSPIGGLLRPEPVYIRGSMHVPPKARKVAGLMVEMLGRYAKECAAGRHPVEAAALLHFDLVTIHPFMDGYGRTARLLQNLALIESGYAPILSEPEERATYFATLQAAQTAVPGVSAIPRRSSTMLFVSNSVSSRDTSGSWRSVLVMTCRSEVSDG